MSQISSRYSLSLNTEYWLAFVLVVFTSVSIRLTEFPLWQDAAYFVGGERLMATHDAYAWLAGAKGIGGYTQDAFSQILSLIHRGLGIDLAVLGFWLPVIFVPLLAIPVCLLARFLRLPEGGLAFGILATSGLGYLVRTRLGFCDTDIISLFVPLSVTCLLAGWLMRMRESDIFEERELCWNILFAAFVGCLGKFGVFVYPGSTSLLFSTYAVVAVLGACLIPKPRHGAMIAGLLVMFAVTFSGWIGAALAGAWVIWNLRFGDSIRKEVYFFSFAIVCATVLFLANTDEIVWWIIRRVFFYAKSSAPDLSNATSTLSLPDIAQSVREAQNLEWSLIGPRLGGNWIIFVLGMLGFGFVTWRRPVLLVFIPFLALGLASAKLGNRFAMYGTVAVGLGLGLGLSELLAMLKQSQGRRWIAQLIMACVALWPSADLMGEMSPAPVLPKVYAQTFVELKEIAEPDALLWQWWDYGYAGQYYAERATMGDGGRQSGPWLYPLAKVHCARSSLHARQMMQYFGQVIRNDGLKSSQDPMIALLAGNPVTGLMEMGAQKSKTFLSDLARKSGEWPDAPPQYFVLSWENLRLSGWISYYGNWDIVSGTSTPGKLQIIQGEVRIDSAQGALVLNGRQTPIDSLDIVEGNSTKTVTWPNGSGMHILVSQASRQVFLMDATMYQSMMVQMLIRPPQEFAEDFTLVVDKYPWARVYKVKG